MGELLDADAESWILNLDSIEESYGSFCIISNTLKIRTPKIIAKNNFSDASKMLNSPVFSQIWNTQKEELFRVCSLLSDCFQFTFQSSCVHGVLCIQHTVIQNCLVSSLITYEEHVLTGPLLKFNQECTEQNYIKIDQ